VNETVLITGSSSGLGMETAVFLAERGFHVYATMRDPKRSTPLEELARKRGVALTILPLDVTRPETIQKAVDRILEERGELYGVVNNAGIQSRGFFEDLSEQEMRDVFETNLLGTLAVTRAVIPCMREAKRGRVVLMGSVGGRIATMGSSAYCSSKFALEGFGEALYQEMQPLGIHVSIVEPGIVPTELFGRNRAVAKKALSRESPYATWFQKLEGATDAWVASRALTPTAVAQVVHRILRARRPRLRYVVGGRAKMLVMGKRLLPFDLADRLYAKKLWQTLDVEPS
jgi:NAD(P)-dependent dehydrogenase (short-subunit alcohol dehydrogenase family)